MEDLVSCKRSLSDVIIIIIITGDGTLWSIVPNAHCCFFGKQEAGEAEGGTERVNRENGRDEQRCKD